MINSTKFPTIYAIDILYIITAVFTKILQCNFRKKKKYRRKEKCLMQSSWKAYAWFGMHGGLAT